MNPLYYEKSAYLSDHKGNIKKIKDAQETNPPQTTA